MSKFKRKKNQIGVDKFGLPIYKREKYHHSSATLEQYVICDHTCKEHGRWSHKIVPNLECKLSALCLDYVPCEECVTFGLNVTREEKVKLMSKSQQALIKAWQKIQQENKNENGIIKKG